MNQQSEEKSRTQTAILSLAIGIVVLCLKFYAYKISQSVALKADAIESIVNVLSSGFGVYTIWLSHQPADDNHPYGHGKAEHLLGAFTGGLVSLAAAMIFYETINRITQPSPIQSITDGTLINVLAGLLNGLLAWILWNRSKKLNSQTLRSDAIHVGSDFLSSIGVWIGLSIYIFTGWNWIDPAISFVISVLLAKAGIQLISESTHVLMDGEDISTLNEFILNFKKDPKPEWITIHELKVIRAGRVNHYEYHLVMPEYFSLLEVHRSMEEFENKLKKNIGEHHVLLTHPDPCEKNYCSQCLMSDCKIRVKPFVAKENLTTELARKKDEV